MLTTLESVRQYLGLKDSETNDDDLLFQLVKSVSGKINNKMNRNLEATDYVEKYQGDGTNRILVKQYPVNSVASIYDDIDALWPPSTQKDPTGIIISNQTPGLIMLKADIFLNGGMFTYYNLENIKISYNAGYVTIPDDIEQAANKLVSVEYSKSKGQQAGIKSDRDPKSLEQEAWDDLEQYRRIR